MVSANALRMILRRHGWTVDVAGTVAEANAYLDAHTPDTIILDLMLPDGEGATILERTRRSPAAADVRVVVTTATNDPVRLGNVTALRPDGLLKKPIDVGTLLGALR